MKITLKDGDGKEIPVEVHPGDTFQDLKTRISNDYGLPIDLQNLQFKGHAVTDSQNVFEYISEVFLDKKPPLCRSKTLCRLCAQPFPEMVDIYPKQGTGSTASLDFSNMISSCLPITITKTDRLPKKICLLCVDQLKECQNFHRITLDAEQTLVDLCMSENKTNRADSNTPSQDNPSSLIDIYKNKISSKLWQGKNLSNKPDKQINQTPPIKTESKLKYLNNIEGKEVEKDGEIILVYNMEDVNTNDELPQNSKMIKRDLLQMAMQNMDDSLITPQSPEVLPDSALSEEWLEEDVDNPIESELSNGNEDKASLERALLLCKWCSEILKSREELFHHSLTHSKNPMYVCGFCDNYSLGISNYTQHYLENHSDKSIVIPPLTKETQEEVQKKPTPTRLHPSRLCSCCMICHQVFMTKEQILQHISDHKESSSEKRWTNVHLRCLYTCSVCDAKFTGLRHLLVHKQDCSEANLKNADDETDEDDEYSLLVCENIDESPIVDSMVQGKKKMKLWNCRSCCKLFFSNRDLYQHKRGEDILPEAKTNNPCDKCKKIFGSTCALRIHMKTHFKTKHYPCEVCGRNFKQSGHLAIHMLMHTGERPFSCDLCSKAFKVKIERDDHRRTHTGERPFSCSICSKTFTAMARLREHSRIHTNHRPYKCSVCCAAFRRPYARTVHMLIHTGEKPHECDLCGTTFRRSGDMWKHKRQLHNKVHPDRDKKATAFK